MSSTRAYNMEWSPDLVSPPDVPDDEGHTNRRQSARKIVKIQALHHTLSRTRTKKSHRKSPQSTLSPDKIHLRTVLRTITLRRHPSTAVGPCSAHETLSFQCRAHLSSPGWSEPPFRHQQNTVVASSLLF